MRLRSNEPAINVPTCGTEGSISRLDAERFGRDVKELFDGTDKILVVVDNFETFEDDKGFAWDVFKDVAGSIQFLVTSRHKRGEAEQPVHLAGLPEADALTLLEAAARRRDAQPLLSAGPPLRRRVVRECDQLPLAIKTIVGWVTKGVSVQTALEGFRAVTGEGIHEFCFEESYELIGEPDRTVAFTMATIDEAVTQDELHACLGLEMASLEAAIASLEDLSIVDVTRTDDEAVVVQMPNLPREYFRRRLKVETQHQASSARFAKAILKARVDDDSGTAGLPVDLVAAGKAARLAFRYGQTRQYVEADRFWTLAVEANGTSPAVWARFGYYQALMKGELEAGLRSLKKALMLSAESGHTWFVRGIVERKLGRFDDAMDSLTKAGEKGEEEHLVNTNRLLTLFEMAKAKYRDGRRSEARVIHERTVALAGKSWAPKDGDSRHKRHNAMLASKLAKSMSYLGRHREALAVVRDGLRARPNDQELAALLEELQPRAAASRS